MAGPTRLLLIDDDEALREALAEQFAAMPDFSLSTAATAGEGLAALKGEPRAELVILDVNLPDMDGRVACQTMRREGWRGPVIMLTAQDSPADEILGLESGANDYVAKPFRFAVLMARIRAHLRQHATSDDARFTLGPYEFRPAAKLLIAPAGRKLRLTEKETAILKFLLRAGTAVVGRDVLLNEVWGYQAGVTTHTLETHIYRLRQKIERDPAQAEILVTESGGYKLLP